MKHIKSFKQLNEEVSGDSSPINCNSGACSLHLNFDIGEITKGDPFIYPGKEYTTKSRGASLLEEFAMAIQKYDLEKIGTFFNGKKTHFDQKQQIVSCGTNNFNIREIPEEVWRTRRFGGQYEGNWLNQRAYDLTTKIEELEYDKIYTCFKLSKDDYTDDFTGVIDVTEPVKKFIEKSKQLNQPIQVR